MKCLPRSNCLSMAKLSLAPRSWGSVAGVLSPDSAAAEAGNFPVFSLFQGEFTMCSDMSSRYMGLLLLTLATAAIISNLLLYFPNGQVLEPAKITDLVWFFHGFLGAGLLVRIRFS